MKGSVSIDETAHINKELAEVPADASLATIILMRVGEQCATARSKIPHSHTASKARWNTTPNLCTWSQQWNMHGNKVLYTGSYPFWRLANPSRASFCRNWTLANQHDPQQWFHQTLLRGYWYGKKRVTQKRMRAHKLQARSKHWAA